MSSLKDKRLMSEIEKQVVIEDALPQGENVVKHKRPKIKRREVVNGKPKLGRPTKAAIAKKKNPGVLGRPPGDAARIAEFKARLLATAGDSVITKIIETALADGHPAQGAMLKFCGERLLPLSSFEAKSGGGTPQISINITGINSPSMEVIDNDAEINAEISDVVIKDIPRSGADDE
jgi:hypothetical protein